MTIKITTPNGGSDSLDFGCAQTAIVATVTGTEVSSGEGKLEFKTTTGGTSAAKVTIAANGVVGIGTANVPSNDNTVTPTLNVAGSGVKGAAQITRHGSLGGGGALIQLAATRGDDVNSYTVVQDGDGIGQVAFLAADGDEFVYAASITAQVDGTPGNDDMPGRLNFNTTADGSKGATERMRITSTGNVGINRAAPVTKLHIEGGGTSLPATTGTTPSAGTTLRIRPGDNAILDIGGNSATGAWLQSYDQTGMQTKYPLLLNPNGGDVSIGTTTRTAKFNVYAVGGSTAQIQNNIAAGTNAIVQIGFLNDNGLIGSIQSSGTSTSYVTSSDYRLKENVEYEWSATERLKKLKPARFNFIADAEKTFDGFLAHEAQEVVPEAVTGVKDEVDDKGIAVMQGIDQAKLVPLLVKTIQELEARIAVLEGSK